MYGRKAWDIAAYTYRASIYCPTCIIASLPTGPDGAFYGWKDVSIPPMSAEDNLDEIAAAFGIDRQDEYSFDSDDFPKVIFVDQTDGDTCDTCGESL